jgi:hypothetical protein
MKEESRFLWPFLFLREIYFLLWICQSLLTGITDCESPCPISFQFYKENLSQTNMFFFVAAAVGNILCGNLKLVSTPSFAVHH